MSGPYRFTGESAKSPLDRTSSPFSAGQPVSFKTNVNRAKTKKWVTAKKNAYDGDDWGGYDEYDEYGADEEEPPQPSTAQRYYAGGQQQQFEQPQRSDTDRSFTDPQGPPGKARRNSFEAGEEHRAFSASMLPPQQQQQGYGQQHEEPQNRRDFTPTAMPPPLQTRVSAVPSDIGASPTQYPPRKSSIGQGDSPMATSPKPRTGSHSDKPLPFERERERASLDSSRPSLDSLTSRPKDDPSSPTSDGERLLQPLDTVPERKSEYLPDLPDFNAGLAPTIHANAVSSSNDQGFRSVVDQAFTRTDDLHSASDMSRSNTGSTAGISPIMSRVPSSATSALKRSQAGEPSETTTQVPQPTSTFLHDATQSTASRPFVDHSRNLSNSSIPRSGLATPTKGDSPARSPVIAPRKDLPEPKAPQAMQGGLSGQSAAYAAPPVPALGAAEKHSQDAFLESHVAQSPSPSKGHVSHSRRGSTQSNLSRNSVQSWEKSQDNSRAPSPTKGSPSKPSSSSYATTAPAMTPSDQGDRELGLGLEKDKAAASLEETELTPTTAKRPVTEVATDESTSDPIATLKSAGAAMAQSFRTTIGLDDGSSADHRSKAPAYGDRTESSLSSIPPTPPAKDTPTNEEPPQLSTQAAVTTTPTQHKRPDFFPQLSTDPSIDDQESDRLRKEIVASLTPVTTADPQRANRASSILPAEYDSYWADGGEHASPRASHDADRSIPALSTATTAPGITQPSEPPKSSLLNRFSWEANNPLLVAPVDTAAPEEKMPSPAIERAAEEERQQWSEGLPNPYFGPGHTLTITQPDPISDPEVAPQSPVSPPDYGSLSSPTREQTRSPGLHVVNSALNPEAVDLPPRLSADLASPRRSSQENGEPLQDELSRETTNPAISASVAVPEPGHTAPVHEPATAFAPEPPAKSPTSPTSGKPLQGREIAAINSTAERIATYNKTREHWAKHDHGLDGWLVSALEANPNIATQSMPVQRTSTGTIRHKHTPRQLEAKGKDLLHTANVLSGKGLTSAKGLFAKGKSRFGNREKEPNFRTDSMPSSREASEKPEFLSATSRADMSSTTTHEKPLHRASTDLEGSSERKKRRFSLSSFHRSSRSRSRPSSIALPSNTSVFSATPRGTPPREVTRILGADGSRPHSYHAPDSWNIAPGPQPAATEQATPSREDSQAHQSRLGILPSPAKSAFSTQDRDNEQDIPPVPALPETVRLSNDLSHEVLQSVIRYSTPPIPVKKDGRTLVASPLLPGTPSMDPGEHDARNNDPSEQLSREVPPRLDYTLLTSGNASSEKFDDGNTPPHIDYGQWPLTPEAQPEKHDSLRSENRARKASGHGMPPDTSLQATESTGQASRADDADDDDDCPPQLSYDPLPPSNDSDFAKSLPAYLVPTHQDVSDDEDSGADHNAHRTDSNSLLQTYMVNQVDANSPTIAPMDVSFGDQRGDTGTNTPTQHEYAKRHNYLAKDTGSDAMEHRTNAATQQNFNVGTEPQAHETPATCKLPAASNESIQPVGLSKTSANMRALLQAQDIKTQLEEQTLSGGAGNTLQISSRAHEVDNEVDNAAAPKALSRDQTGSPTPVWFAKGGLQVPKTRAQGFHGPQIAQTEDATSDSEGGRVSRLDAQAAPRTLHADPLHELRPASAQPFQVVHAVEEYAASGSSFASWDRDSFAAKSISGTSPAGDMRDESDLVTPVAQGLPRIVQHDQADKAEDMNHNSRKPGTPNGYFGGHDVQSHAIRHQQQQSSDLTVPERSKSMLSMISSMVSDGSTPISPSSSNAGRSTPSTIRRMQRDSISNSVKPAQIPEESMAMSEDRTPTAKDDDFDLYADHNGVVKDLRDGNGQPLRVAQAQGSGNRPYGQPTQAGVPIGSGGPEARGEERPRYSTERPMSFISGPTDQDGRPQDQVNQPLPQSNSLGPRAAEQNYSQTHQSQPGVIGTVYSVAPPAQAIQQASLSGLPRIESPGNPSAQASLPSANNFREVTPVPQNTPGLVGPRSSPQYQQTPLPSNPSAPPAINGQSLYSGQNANYHAQTSQLSVERPGHSAFQGQVPVPERDPRLQGQPGAPNATGPRNEYEFQQQMMQLQARYPRSQGSNGQLPDVGPQPPVQQPPKPQEKSFSKPKFASVFKGLGGKLQGNSQQPTHSPSGAHQPQSNVPVSNAPPMDAHRNDSYTSGVSSLHQEQLVRRPGERPAPSGPMQRPPSNGAESHFSHVSQNSARVEPTVSRLDLRKPASPAPYQGIPPQQIPHSAPAQGAQLQSYRASSSGVPDTGKKKRFSTLGNIFGRGSDAPKLSKEAKKAQKTQRHSTAPAMQTSQPQWPPQQAQFRLQQSGMPYPPAQMPPGQQYPPGQYPPQQMRPMGPQFASPQTMSPATPQSAQSRDPYGVPQHYQQPQPRLPGSQQAPGANAEPVSAYLRTKQLAEEHQAQKALASAGQQGPMVSRPGTHASATSFDQASAQSRQTSYGPPPGGYYNPNPTSSSVPEKGAYQTSQATRLLAEQQRQPSTTEQSSYGVAQVGRQQLQYQQHSALDEDAYRALQAERMRLERQRLQLESEQGRYQDAQTSQGLQRHEQVLPPKPVYNTPGSDPQQRPEEQPQSTEAGLRSTAQERQPPSAQPVSHGPSRDELLRAHQERQQREQDLRSQQYAERVQPVVNNRSVSQPLPLQSAHPQHPVTQRNVSSSGEPQYETPQIPAAYSHVSGAFISPRDREQQPLYSAPQAPPARPSDYSRQYSDPRMPSLSPQVSAQSQMPPNNRTHSDASTVSVVSPISGPAPDVPSNAPAAAQRVQKPRMSSISEVHQGTPERPWHLKFPEGATEQEIVRARQRQFMQEQFTAQQQQHAERAAQSPSPRASPHSQSPATLSSQTVVPQQQGGGFKELLPRSSPQPYPQPQPNQSSQQEEQARNVDNLQPAQPAPIHPGQPTQPQSYPLPMSPDPANTKSPVNPLASALPAPPLLPPKLPHSPMHPVRPQSVSPQAQHIPTHRGQYEPSPPQQDHHSPPPPQNASYDQQEPDEPPPPSYDGPGMPNDGMDKTRPDQTRPPNINTDADVDNRGRQGESRPRQPSIGILQHPQPASMAASPQRSSADMGAESLRRQLLQQEEVARMERIQLAQVQRAETERERLEREAARARARELERSVSGGARVGSIRSVTGTRNGGQPGWERRGSTSRQVFELPAVEDDEPAMRATSYPGQEWVPPVWMDD
ncbi:hypothetical protein EK21DRAFT_100516 [Setomelanomma holmii]|uniref:SWI-SNF chromatin-remodeling complex protein n=1 Tax=Setomelanomma holmii TaxID=210430 RepID=A0A9P4HAR3_9PLEO|nr:hypothetical protein EK21DRAFT_100516 [Setomelanomma holmii]